MRWERFFEGLESLWDSEMESAEVDERRELIRAERSRLRFADVVQSRAQIGPLTVSVMESDLVVHATVVGATWLEGVVCGSRRFAIVPFDATVAVSTPSCDCDSAEIRVFSHLTIGARLRALERTGSNVEVKTAKHGFRGRVEAVWRDSFDLNSGPRVWLVRLSAVCYITLGGT